MKLTKDQITTLLYLETRLVDYDGRVNGVHMNAADFEWARKANDCGFIGFGRIVLQDVTPQGANWVTFSDAAWEAAHKARRERAERGQKRRQYRTTPEASSRVSFSE